MCVEHVPMYQIDLNVWQVVEWLRGSGARMEETVCSKMENVNNFDGAQVISPN